MQKQLWQLRTRRDTSEATSQTWVDRLLTAMQYEAEKMSWATLLQVYFMEFRKFLEVKREAWPLGIKKTKPSWWFSVNADYAVA